MKAIIPAAGHGTRFLPVTRVVPKEMLPIGAKPALELIVDEAKSAGADEIVLVISRGKELIRAYFEGDPSIRFVYQEEQRGLGHAVMTGLEALEPPAAGGDRQASLVLVLLGDALVAGCNAAQEMVAFSAAHGGAGVVGLERVPAEKVSRYGIVKCEGERIVDLVEKPRPEDAPSDLAIAGRYLLDSAILGYLRTQTPGKGGEIQLTDAIRRMVMGDRPPSVHRSPFTVHLYGYVYPGRRQDIGNPKGYFDALKAMGANE